jgi:hypothetical protein
MSTQPKSSNDLMGTWVIFVLAFSLMNLMKLLDNLGS